MLHFKFKTFNFNKQITFIGISFLPYRLTVYGHKIIFFKYTYIMETIKSLFCLLKKKYIL